MPNTNLIAKGTLVQHIAEDILAKIVGYIDFNELDIADYGDVRYVLRGLDAQNQFREGHACNGARSVIDWHADMGHRYGSGFWYAAENDFTVVTLEPTVPQPPAEPAQEQQQQQQQQQQRASTDLLPIGTRVKFRTAMEAPEFEYGMIVGYNYRNSAFVSYILYNSLWGVQAEYESFRGHGGRGLTYSSRTTQMWGPNLYPENDNSHSYWFANPGSIVETNTPVPLSIHTRTAGLLPLGTRIRFGYAFNESVSQEGVIVGCNYNEGNAFLSYIVRNTDWENANLFDFQGHNGNPGLNGVRQFWLEGELPTPATERSHWFVCANEVTEVVPPAVEGTVQPHQATSIPFGTRIRFEINYNEDMIEEATIVGANYTSEGTFASYIVRNTDWARPDSFNGHNGIATHLEQVWAENTVTTEEHATLHWFVEPREIVNQEVQTPRRVLTPQRVPLGTQIVLRGHSTVCTIVGYNFDADNGSFVDYIVYNPAWTDGELGHTGCAGGYYNQQWLAGFEPRADIDTSNYWFANEDSFTVSEGTCIVKPANEAVRRRAGLSGAPLEGTIIGHNFHRETGAFLTYIMYAVISGRGHSGRARDYHQRWAPCALDLDTTGQCYWVTADQLV